MIRLLIVTYNFPPEGGPAVQRISKFIKYLAQFDTKIFVLTASKKIKIKDESLLADVKNCTVISSADYGKYFPGELKKIFWKYFIPDKSNLWKISAVKKGIKIVKKENVDLIISTSPPHSTHLIAGKIAKQTKTKWITDFRDEWIDNSLFVKSKLKEKQKHMEISVLKNCNHIITVTNKAKNNFARRIESSKISVIENGFDEDDFNEISLSDKNDVKKLVISYSGRFNELHSPKVFFTAMSQLIIENKIDTENLSVNIIGNIENKKWLNNFPNLNSVVTFINYLPHKQMLNELGKADVLLLLATNMNSTEFFPAKMFEYFRLRKPIFAVVSSKGELSNLLSEYGNSLMFLEADIEKIKSGLLNLLKKKKEEINKVKVSEEFLERFNRKNQAFKLYEQIKNQVG
ncbi:MAG: glycosyltransferase [Ignavibacteriae bacterium]|nr:glycosyltransferase [Ignavibacteriota bacterium]